MKSVPTGRSFALLESTIATLIWASSFIIAAAGIGHLGMLSMAGLRYTLAGLVLLPFALWGRQSILQMPAWLWGRLLVIGLLGHSLGNGAIFLALDYLSPTTLTFVTCCLPVPVLLIGMAHLGEQPTGLQLIGLAVALGGGLLFFSPGLGGGEWLGLGLASLGLVSFSYSSVFGRAIAREKQASTAALTGLPLVMGGAPLLLVAWLWEGAPHPSLVAWQVVIALALLNTVIAYSLYYHSMQVLTAFEANMLLNLAPLGTAVLAWYVYDERITLVQIVGMLVVIFGITLVQWRPAPPRPQTYAQTA